MTLSFMAFFSFVLATHIAEQLGEKLLWPLLIIGLSSVLFWAYTESIGQGDLRFYALVQFLPIILIPVIILSFPTSSYKQLYVWLVVSIYVIAKLLEYFDYPVYDLVGVSGHSLKHIVAAMSGIVFLRLLKSMRHYDKC